MRGRAIIHEYLRKVLAALISEHVKKASHSRRRASSRIPSDLLVSYIASTFILVLNWWVEHKSTQSKEGAPMFAKMVIGERLSDAQLREFAKILRGRRDAPTGQRARWQARSCSSRRAATWSSH
jgi:hypothetical protein